MKKRRPELNTVSQVVCANTGMSAAQLLHDTRNYVIKGLDTAAQMIKEAIQEHRTIVVPGDYDVDGIMASGIIYITLCSLRAHCIVRLPRRFSEGYGLKEKMVAEFEPGQLMITVDNGIASLEAIKLAKKKGMTVIVTDHHLPVMDEETGLPVFPEADLIINPNAIPGTADFNGYCGAGLAYKLALELLGTNHPLIPKLKSLAAIATIADSVPLVDENRRIVKEGLAAMVTKDGTTMGLYALLYLLYLNKCVTANHVGFKIAPAINAPGRLRDDGSMDAFRLMVFDGTFQEAKAMAELLLEDNELRRELSEEWTKKAITAIEQNGQQHDIPIVTYLPGVPEGIIGIIAGRLAEHFQSPCFVLGDTANFEVIKGSSRSYGGVHLKKLLDQNQQFLLTYGGHAPAAGLSLKKEKLVGFRQALIDTLYGCVLQQDVEEYYDLQVPPEEINELMKELDQYAPYGEGNPSPVIMLNDLKLKPVDSQYYQTISADRGIKLTAAELEAVSFDGAEVYKTLNNPKRVTLIGTLSRNYFNGKSKIQMEYQKVIPVETLLKKSPLALALERRAHGRYAK